LDKIHAAAGLEICQIGHIALEGTLALLEKERERLKLRLPESYLKEAGRIAAEELERFSLWKAGGEKAPGLPSAPDAVAGLLQGLPRVSVEEGGILPALWELGELAGCGFRVALREILVRQETVEICEAVGEDVYALSSGGCVLVLTDRGRFLCDRMKEKKIPAAVIGTCTEKRAKILVNGEEERYLDKPRSHPGL
jgi:hydrogenase maturation factor